MLAWSYCLMVCSVGSFLLLIAIGGQLSIYIFNLDSELVGSDAIIITQLLIDPKFDCSLVGSCW